MGFLDRLNRAAGDVVQPVFSDPSFKRGDRVLERGEQISGRIVGIERKLDGGNDTELFAFEATTLRGPLRAGARVRTDRMERLRLGMPVLLRGDDSGHAVLDWPAMSAGWGFGEGNVSQKLLRKPPDDGIREAALDMRVERRLKKGTPARATVTALERRTLMGLALENWNIALALADGRSVATAGDQVPFYVSWFVVPGAEVPVSLDPKDQGRATIDWAALALEQAQAAGAMNDPPPAGSVADLIERDRAATPAESVASTMGPPAAQASPDLEPIEGVTLELWAAIEVGTARDRVPPKDYDAYAETHGAPAGRWTAIDAAWKARMQSDWRIGAAMGEAVSAARKKR
jgi:hypothetical protein